MTKLKQVLKQMLKEKEFGRIIESVSGKEKRQARSFYNAIKDFNDEDFEKVPEIIFIRACKSWSVWQDIYCYLELLDAKEK